MYGFPSLSTEPAYIESEYLSVFACGHGCLSKRLRNDGKETDRIGKVPNDLKGIFIQLEHRCRPIFPFDNEHPMLRQPDIKNFGICRALEALGFAGEFRSQSYGPHNTLLDPNEAKILGGGRRERKEIIWAVRDARRDVLRCQEFSRVRREGCHVEGV